MEKTTSRVVLVLSVCICVHLWQKLSLIERQVAVRNREHGRVNRGGEDVVHAAVAVQRLPEAGVTLPADVGDQRGFDPPIPLAPRVAADHVLSGGGVEV